MSEQTPSDSPATPDDAMNRALQAEQRALDDIKKCEREAEMLVGGAQQQSRLLVERTDRRIQSLHLRCARATAELVDAMAVEDAREAGKPDRPESDAKALEAAVERIAARLTGPAQADGKIGDR